ncbi:GntR family transcriptional regulator [Methylocapsa sp. S129]|uniref:GntR family transcriptional regulator n=1 Tax=Methylocapsa sp. S129 TaxID=1641869 RepID=UPI00131DEE1B|nr:GntR family transcriptional regulator [Methylocapsa sp. S129]
MGTARNVLSIVGRKKNAAVAIDRGRSVPPQVYEVLREKILTVQLKPGESINERWLADWLGVSRTPIREAINRLSANGLIAIIPNVGTSVSLINVARVKEFNLIRTSLESMIVRLAAERFDDSAAVMLSDLIDRQIATLEVPDLIENIVVDSQFHRAIAEISGLNATWAILQHAMDEILRVRHLSVRLPRPLREPIDEHLAILDALRTRDPDLCERAMKTHLDSSYKHVVSALEQHPEYLENQP